MAEKGTAQVQERTLISELDVIDSRIGRTDELVGQILAGLQIGDEPSGEGATPNVSVTALDNRMGRMKEHAYQLSQINERLEWIAQEVTKV